MENVRPPTSLSFSVKSRLRNLRVLHPRYSRGAIIHYHAEMGVPANKGWRGCAIGECAPRIGQFHAAILTVCRAW